MAYYVDKDTYVGNTGKQLKHIKTNSDNIAMIGTMFEHTGTNVVVSGNNSNVICSLTLDPGTYIVVGTFKYEGSNLRYYLSLWSRSISAYDNAGYVEGTVTDIFTLTSQRTIELRIWPSKDATLVTTNIRAIRVK